MPEALGAALGLLLWFAFGAEIGVATLPFADGGATLVCRTLLHFAAMAATVAAWSLLNFRPVETLAFLVPLALVYVLVWLGRWVGWYVELTAIREKLGLAPGPSPLKWRETLPYLPFAALLCLALPLVLRLCDGYVPVLSGMLYPYLLLPVGGFCSGLSLGRRRGVCPLYPAACVLGILVFIPLARLFSNMYDWPLVTIALVCSLAGNMTPAALVCWLVILSSPVLIRRLAPEPVRLKLRITALWLPWCAVVCTLLPVLLMWRLGTGGILIAIYLLPFGCMALGMALGKQHGLCPLFPLACALCLLPIARGLYHMAGALCLEPAVFALLGNAAGAYPRKSAGR